MKRTDPVVERTDDLVERTDGSVERTTTAEALLGVLSMGPMTGYQLRQRIEESIGKFWSESYGQIYPTLKRLVADGLAETVAERGPVTRSGRKVYRLTGAGQKRLRHWLRSPSAQQVARNEVLLKIFFAGRVGPPVVREQVEALRTELRAQLSHYAAIRRRFAGEYARFADAPYWRMTLEYGVVQTEALLQWCESTLVELETMEEARDAS